MILILRPVHYSQAKFYASHTKVDASLSSGPLGETRGHVSNIALSEAEEIDECLKSTFIADDIVVALRAKPDPSKDLVYYIPCGL